MMLITGWVYAFGIRDAKTFSPRFVFAFTVIVQVRLMMEHGTVADLCEGNLGTALS